MSTVFALVRILKFFDVDDYWFSLLQGYGSKRGSPKRTARTHSAASRNHGSGRSFSRHRLTVLSDKFLALELDVESAPALRAVSEELQPRDAVFLLGDEPRIEFLFVGICVSDVQSLPLSASRISCVCSAGLTGSNVLRIFPCSSIRNVTLRDMFDFSLSTP